MRESIDTVVSVRRRSGMKSTFRTINMNKWKQKWMGVLTTGRSFLYMALASAVFFIVISLGGLAGQHLMSSPTSSMQGFVSQMSAQWFVQMLSLELPKMEPSEGELALSKRDAAEMLVRLVANVNPYDPKTVLAGELPGASRDSSVLLRSGSGNKTSLGPEDFSPLPSEGGRSHGGEPHPSDALPLDGFETVDPNSGKTSDPDEDTGIQEKVVLIYHTHNRESWIPELEKPTDNPNDAKVNITMVGKHLRDQLEKHGVGAKHSNKDYASTVKGYSWNYSYKYSGETVKEAMSDNEHLEYFLDIHRDSAQRENSTVEIKGKSYAQVYFIIGHRNPNWKQNEAFAAEIHELLEERYPGLSRGVWGKDASTGNAEYNQSLSPNSIVVEIGGVENTLEENYRTAGVLAEIVSEIIHGKRGSIPAVQPINEQDQKDSNQQDLSSHEKSSAQHPTTVTGG